MAHGYRLSVAQELEPYWRDWYRYIVWAPDQYATNWVAFRELAGLHQFAFAYNLLMEPLVPEQGQNFELHLPSSNLGWLDVWDNGQVYVPSTPHIEVAPMEWVPRSMT